VTLSLVYCRVHISWWAGALTNRNVINGLTIAGVAIDCLGKVWLDHIRYVVATGNGIDHIGF
jgi:hypothetical protein